MRGEREHIQIPTGRSFRVLRWQQSLREVECVLGPDRATSITGEGAHWHFHVEMELTLFTHGEGTRFVGDHLGTFAPGDLVLLGEKLPHYWHTRGRSSGLSVQWHFPESHPFWAFPETLALTELFKLANRGLHITGRTASEVALLLHALPSHTGATQLATLLQLLGRLSTAPEADRRSLSTRSFVLPASSQYQDAIARAVRYLVANFREEIRLETVLALTGMSRPTFARQFKQHSGRTFSEFLNRLRCQTACRDLEQSDRSILDIALGCGFTQVSFFNRLFRRLMRCSPSQFRARRRRRSVRV